MTSGKARLMTTLGSREMNARRACMALVLSLIAPLLTSCTLPFTRPGAGPIPAAVMMERPYRSTLYPVGATTSISASASTPAGGVEAIEFFANGASLGVVSTDRASADVVATLDWTPTTAGSYVLQAHARGLPGVAISEPVTVCVAAVLDYQLEGYGGPCSFERSSSTDPVGIASQAADPATWAYDNGRCSSVADVAPGDPEMARRFHFTVVIEDPGRRAAIVVVHLQNPMPTGA